MDAHFNELITCPECKGAGSHFMGTACGDEGSTELRSTCATCEGAGRLHPLKLRAVRAIERIKRSSGEELKRLRELKGYSVYEASRLYKLPSHVHWVMLEHGNDGTGAAFEWLKTIPIKDKSEPESASSP